MTSMSELWPASGLVVRSGDLTLSTITDDDLPALVDLVRSGIHDPDAMPFATGWTRTPDAELPREFAAYHWGMRASPRDAFRLDLAVRADGVLVGTQGIATQDYPITRSAETGSWLARSFQGRGIGTRMRQAMCALLFDHLGAVEITSNAWLDNPASLAVSRKVGYRQVDVSRKAREGALVLDCALRLRPDDLVRGEPIEVSGVEPLRAFLGVG